MEDVARRRDRVAAVEQRLFRQAGRGDQTDCGGLVAADLSVGSRGQFGLGHGVPRREDLRGFPEVVARAKHLGVRLGHGGDFAELLLDPLERRLHVPAEHPVDQAQREEVFAAADGTARQSGVFAGRGVEFFDRYPVQLVVRQGVVFEGVFLVSGLGEVVFGEGVLVDDEDAAGLEVPEIRLQRRGIHGDHGIDPVAWCSELACTEVELVSGNARQGTGRGPDLRREVRQGADVVSEGRRSIRELRPHELHAVA